VPSHLGTLTPPGEYDWTCASFGSRESTTQTANQSAQTFLHRSQHKVPILYSGRPFPSKMPLLLGSRPHPWAILSPQSKRHHDRFSRFRTGDRRMSLYFTIGRHFPSKLPLPMGDLEPHLTHDSLGPSEPTTQTTFWSVQPFCTDDRRVSLYFTMGRPFPLKIAPSHGGSWPPSNTWFPGPTRVLDSNGILIGSAVFAELTSVTDRQTDHATQSVTIDRMYVGYVVQAIRSKMGYVTLTTPIILGVVCHSKANTWYSLPVCKIWRLWLHLFQRSDWVPKLNGSRDFNDPHLEVVCHLKDNISHSLPVLKNWRVYLQPFQIYTVGHKKESTYFCL